MKKIYHITVNLTDEENELIQRIAQDLERKPAELARILMLREARRQWASMSAIDNEPIKPNYKA